MSKKPLVSIALLNEILRLEPERGKLFWRLKTPDMVDSERESTRLRIARNWNARYQGKQAFTNLSLRGYLTGVIQNRRYYAHRVVWALHYGEWPNDQIDHINGNRLDNRIQNLRVATDAENRKNQCVRSDNRTGIAGVWWDQTRQKYQAYINHDGRRIHLGRYESLDDAAAARKEAERQYGYHENHGGDFYSCFIFWNW